ncbi:hypothetical protein MUK42_20589 [Musa troglodytarum]|uniref:Uncharacterized protein n=1 Tax=Musa troglodytarum TaxID=320322 RepID=A0A9E7JFD5_9LILI|nr:hypothetical protein MUK42_20589 [Musa troglodytarum]
MTYRLSAQERMLNEAVRTLYLSVRSFAPPSSLVFASGRARGPGFRFAVRGIVLSVKPSSLLV